MAQPPLVLDPPIAAPPPEGLFAAIGAFRDMPAHAQNQGAVWVPDTTVTDHAYAAPCQAPPYTAFTTDAMDRLAMAFPFAVYSSINSAALGLSDEELGRRVKQRLVNYEQNIVESVFWGTSSLAVFSGVQNYAGALADGTPTGTAGTTGGVLQQFAAAGTNAGFQDLTGGGPYGTVEAVSRLEQSIADNYYGLGYIHARPRMGAYLGYKRQLKDAPTPSPIHGRTWNDVPVILGNGYTGTGPTGQAPNNSAATPATEYMWATGRVLIWRDADVTLMAQPAQLLNRTTNQRVFYAVRQYMIGIEGFAAVIQVDRQSTAP